MKILINFSTIKKGGGQNVALNFLLEFSKTFENRSNFHFFVAKNSKIHAFLKNNSISNVYVFPNNPLLRIIYEILIGNKILRKIKPDIIYSYFGYGLFSKKYLQVSGSADSNLFYPEVNFWTGYKGLNLLAKKVIDKYRLWGLKKAHAVIFENKELELRFRKLFCPSKLTITILPSIASSYSQNEYVNERLNMVSSPKGLFLCGWHLNKNIMLIPNIARCFKDNNIDFHFILTAPEDNSILHRQFIQSTIEFGVEDMISIIGQITKEELPSLYKQIDFVFLLSKLESFSNNIIEAFYFNRPLVISDEPWARQLCGDSAVFVNRDNPENITFKVNELLKNKIEYKKYINLGSIEIKKYPTIRQKIQQEIDFLNLVYEKFN